MFDLITIGSISIDMYYRGDALTQKEDRFALAIGGKYPVEHFYSGLGGGAANVAIGVQKHGFKAAIVGKIGNNHFKKMILEHLEVNGLTDALCQYEDEYMKISSILLAPSGERTIIHYETPHEHILRDDGDMHYFEKTKMLYMSNLWRVPLHERERILCHAHAKGVLTLANLGIADCRRQTEQIKGLLSHVDILILNAHECAEILRKDYKSINWMKDITKGISFLADKHVIVTDGVKGSYWYSKGAVKHIDAHTVAHVVDTTGAGDAYSAGFISGYLEKGDIEYGMKVGAKYASHIVQMIGANESSS